LPWRLGDDLRRFKKLTIGENQIKQNVVLMGRKTWQSLPPNSRPLPNRRNIVLTRQADFSVPEGVLKFFSLEDALASIEEGTQCFVIGGGEIYTEAIANPLCRLLYVTEVDGDFDCDVFFPPYQDSFIETPGSKVVHESSIDYCYKLFERKQSV
jgi:dihydrofolate reductase